MGFSLRKTGLIAIVAVATAAIVYGAYIMLLGPPPVPKMPEKLCFFAVLGVVGLLAYKARKR